MNTTCFNPGCNKPAKVKFCSKSCSAIYNNTMLPRRQPEHKCKNCSKPINALRRYCSDECRIESTKYHGTKTIGDLRSKSTRHAQVYNALRQRSRSIAITNGLSGCIDCGWDEHVEVCHINDLAKLPDSTTVEDATGPSNFILLCPNHHWKFDHDKDYRANLLAGLVGFEPTVGP